MLSSIVLGALIVDATSQSESGQSVRSSASGGALSRPGASCKNGDMS
jgi:hypothetical protein